jgi:hypothetical protein
VAHPDTLISSTSVVGSLFCARRGVLSEWFRGIDGDSTIMVIGSLVHELLQEVIHAFLFSVVCSVVYLSLMYVGAAVDLFCITEFTFLLYCHSYKSP